MKIELLQWDTDFFEIKIGRLVLYPEDNFDSILFEEEASAKNYDLVYVFSMSELMQAKKTNIVNLDLVDIQITMSKPFVKDKYLHDAYELRRQLTDEEKDECYKIAEETAIYSRFFHEKLIGPVMAKKLYRKWIDNALNKSFSDGIFLKKISDRIEGIHLIKSDMHNKCGYFTLTGVNPELKRMGIGHELWNRSFAYWADMMDIKIIKSPFSLQNINSFNFHLKMGFNKIEEVKYIYHFRNNKKIK